MIERLDFTAVGKRVVAKLRAGIALIDASDAEGRALVEAACRAIEADDLETLHRVVDEFIRWVGAHRLCHQAFYDALQALYNFASVQGIRDENLGNVESGV